MALSDSDILRVHTVAVTGSPAPGFYDTPQNDPAASGISAGGGQIMPSTTAFTNDTDQNIFPVISLSQLSSGTLYGGIAVLNASTGSPGAINVTECRAWWTASPSESGVSIAVAGVGVAGQNATTGGADSTTAVAGLSYVDISNYSSWATGLKFGSGSPAGDRTLLASKGNAFYIFYRITLTSVANQLIKSAGNNLFTLKIGGGES